MLKKVQETTAYIQSKVSVKPDVGIILGTGLGGLAKDIENQQVLSYGDIPNFPVSTVEGHSGRLIFGQLGNKQVVAMQGRFHYYEGYTMEQLVMPVRLMGLMGAKAIFLTNAAGGMGDGFHAGDLMLITDHIAGLVQRAQRRRQIAGGAVQVTPVKTG